MYLLPTWTFEICVNKQRNIDSCSSIYYGFDCKIKHFTEQMFLTSEYIWFTIFVSTNTVYWRRFFLPVYIRWSVHFAQIHNIRWLYRLIFCLSRTQDLTHIYVCTLLRAGASNICWHIVWRPSLRHRSHLCGSTGFSFLKKRRIMILMISRIHTHTTKLCLCGDNILLSTIYCKCVWLESE